MLPQKRARGLKFRIKEVKRLYYPCSKNKGADQAHSYCAADLRLCFCVCNQSYFSTEHANLSNKCRRLSTSSVTDFTTFAKDGLCWCMRVPGAMLCWCMRVPGAMLCWCMRVPGAMLCWYMRVPGAMLCWCMHVHGASCSKSIVCLTRPLRHQLVKHLPTKLSIHC